MAPQKSIESSPPHVVRSGFLLPLLFTVDVDDSDGRDGWGAVLACAVVALLHASDSSMGHHSLPVWLIARPPPPGPSVAYCDPH